MNTVQVQMPQSYLKSCLDRGWDEQEAVSLFSHYIKELINHPYDQTLYDFLQWTEDLDEEFSRSNYPANVEGSVEFNEFNERSQQEGLTIEDLRGRQFTSADYNYPVYTIGASEDGRCTIHWNTNSNKTEVTTYWDKEVEQYVNKGTWVLVE